MTNQLAIIMALVILGAVVADVVLDDSNILLFVGRKFLELLSWVAFWR